MFDAAVKTFPGTGITTFEDMEKFTLNTVKNLSEADINQEYIIKDIASDDEELKNFLFTLGCFTGEPVTVLSVLAENYVISVKDARYSIDTDLARSVLI